VEEDLDESDLEPDDVEFLDEELLVEENTGQVSVGEIGAAPGAVEDLDDLEEELPTQDMAGVHPHQEVWPEGEGQEEDVTSIRSEEDLASSGKVQRLDLEDLEEMGGEEDMSFLDRPTAEVELPQAPDLMEEERRDPLKVAEGFNTQQSWEATGEHGAAPEAGRDVEEVGAEEVGAEEIDMDGGSRVGVEAAAEAEPKAEAGPELEGEPGLEQMAEPAAEAAAEPEPEAEPEPRTDPEAEDGVEPEAEQQPGGALPEMEGRIERRSGDLGLEALGDLPEPDQTGASALESDRAAFQEQAHRLALRKRWEALALLTRQALVRAPWAEEGPARAALLLDLGRIYADRLADSEKACVVFEELLREDPSSRKALDFLAEHYEAESEWESLFDLHLESVESTWDPGERLDRTRQAAEIAEKRLQDSNRAIQAWERLWRLGGGLHQVRAALTELYRDGGQWKALARFLSEDAKGQEPAERSLQLREVAELCLYGAKDLERAKDTVESLLVDDPKDPVALLARAEVLARLEEWDALSELLGSIEEQLEESTALNLMRWAADALWKGGRQQQATEIYRKVLEQRPDDRAAAGAVEQALDEAGKHEELVSLLESRLERAGAREGEGGEEEAAEILAKLARVAEEKLEDLDRAVGYWKKRIDALDGDMDSYRALASLYERQERWEELAEVLGKELELRRDPSGKRELLSRLGRIYSTKLDDDDRAEKAWRQMLVLDPEDTEARAELMALHRRRGEFEALDKALVREINLADEERAVELCREAARNVEENLSDPPRAFEAWFRVLDRRPRDKDALEGTVRVLESTDQKQRLASMLEREIDATEDVDAKVALGLRAASVWKSFGEEGRVSAACCYERVLKWRPDSVEALQGLCGLNLEGGDVARALSIAELGFLSLGGDDERAAFLRWVAGRLPEDEKKERYALLRRVAALAVPTSEDLDALDELAREVSAEEDLLSLLEEVAERVSERDRPTLRDRAAALCADSLSRPDRAFLELSQQLVAGPADEATRKKLSELAEQTERHEDIYSLYGALVTQAEPAERIELLSARSQVADERLEDGLRAFLSAKRGVLQSPDDEELLSRARKLAERHELWVEMDGLYGELIATVGSAARRIELARARHDLGLKKLDDRLSAFHQLVFMYRLSPQESLEEVIENAADELAQWDYWLPVLEANARFGQEGGRPERLSSLAKSYVEHLDDGVRASVLSCLALEKEPEGFGDLDEQRELAEQNDAWNVLVDSLRLGGARSEGSTRSVELLEKAAAIEEEKLENHQGSVEVHRRILAIKPDAMASLEVCLSYLRESGDQEALQQRLQQWIQHAPEDADRVSRYLELARLAEDGGQPEKALLAYTQILELEPDHQEAREAMDKMADKLSPEQRLRQMKLELRSATGQKAVDLHLGLARHQEEVLGDRRGAIETLRGLTELEGMTGVGQGLLAKLLRKEAQWEELADLLEQRAEAVEEPEAKLDALEEALRVRLEHLRNGKGEGEDREKRVEALCRKILTLRPEDSQAGVLLLHTLRSQGRHQEMAGLLERSGSSLVDPDERFWALFELGRIHHNALGDLDEAKRVYEQLEETDLGKPVAQLALARLAADSEDWPAYLRWREAHAKILPQNLSSLAYCHMAEVSDEKLGKREKTLSFYRRARMLDENNDLARRALKALGRRVKEWRKEATLLPSDDSASLTFEQRAERLAGMAESAGEPRRGIEWLWRALMTHPDQVEIWDALSTRLSELGELEAGVDAQVAALEAFQRVTVPGASLSEEVERFHACSKALAERGLDDQSLRFERRAYDLDPADARAALAVANERFEQGDVKGASKAYRELAAREEGSRLDDRMRAHVTFRLGQAALKLGDPEGAVSAFEDTLDLQPLHGGALVSLGRELSGVGRTAEAARMYLRALTVAEQSESRAQINSRLGGLFEDYLGRIEEAGACYRRALDEGASDLETLWRSLKHAQKAGRNQEALDLISEMLERVKEPEDMAGLWVARGQIHATVSGKEDEAVEAYDMALSYDPGCHEALEGLSEILERRGDWKQLIEVLDATKQVLPPDKQSEVLVRMADISRDHFEDPAGEEAYLQEAAEIAPDAGVLRRLYEIYTEQPDRTDELKVVLGKLVAYGPPYFERAVDLGQLVLEEGRRRWAWCLLSPLSEVRKVDKDLKSQLRDMRKEFDGAELSALSEEQRAELIRHPDHDAALEEVLADVDEAIGPLGASELEQATAGTPSQIGKSTGLGRVLLDLCENLHLDERSAWRADELDEPIKAVNNPEGPMLLLQADFARKLVQNEVRFVFGSGLELTRKGNLPLAALDPKERAALLKGLFSALGFCKTRSKKAKGYEKQLLDEVDVDRLELWADKLTKLQSQKPEELAEKQWSAALCTARRVGLLMSGELHLTIRALERMAGNKIGRQVDNVSDLDERIEEFPERRDLLAFACSPQLGELLEGGSG
jgi:tetratricopeptide (TPR) repeat protein